MNNFRRAEFVFSLLSTSVATIGAILSYSIENVDSCNPDCKVWIAGAATRCFLALTIMIALRFGSPQTNSLLHRILQKILELMDVFGVIWFCVGNLLLFNSDRDCVFHEPICFSVTSALILLVYIYFFGPSLIRCISIFCPCFGFVHEIQLNRLIGELNPPRITQTSNTAPDDKYWLNWLKDQGCKPFFGKLEPSFDNLNSTNTNVPFQINSPNEETKVNLLKNSHPPLIRSDIETPLDNQCAICFEPFLNQPELVSIPLSKPNNHLRSNESLNTVAINDNEAYLSIAFPCRARHVFHTHCLIRWLQTCSSRQSYRADAKLTCPCCRLEPSKEHLILV
jgi:hypothetical protein